MPVGRILWGVTTGGAYHYENALAFGYPPYGPVTDRIVRAGSEAVQMPSGVEDAWITGRDYTVIFEARWIPDSPDATPARSPVSGPLSWQAFLDYARDKHPFRFVPDVAAPDYFIDACYLVEPMRGFGANSEVLTRNVPLMIRNATVDFTRALRGVALEYAPGSDLSDAALGAVFSRAGTANFYSKRDVVTLAPTSVPRDRHYPVGSTVQTLLVEWAATNRAPFPALSTTWVLNNTTLTPNYGTAPDGSTTSALIAQTVASSSGYTLPPTTVMHLAGSSLAVYSMFMHYAGSTVSGCTLGMARSSDGSSLGECQLAWSSLGVPTASALYSPSTFGVQAIGNGWYRAWVRGAPATSQAAYGVLYWCRGAAAATSGTLEVWGPQMEDGPVLTSYLGSTGVTTTRAVDAFSFALPSGLAKPQPMWVYTKHVECGGFLSSAGWACVLSIGSTASGANPRLELWAMAGTRYQATYTDSTGGTVSAVMSTAAANVPAFGDRIELLVTFSSSTGLALYESKNGAADVAGSGGGVAFTPSTAWSAARVALGAAVGSFTNCAEMVAVKLGPGTAINSIALARSA